VVTGLRGGTGVQADPYVDGRILRPGLCGQRLSRLGGSGDGFGGGGERDEEAVAGGVHLDPAVSGQAERSNAWCSPSTRA
jgi:hypothetical protein